MNPPGTDIGLELAGTLGLETLALVMLAVLIQRAVPSATWQRTLWQAVLLALAAVVGLEFLGARRGMAEWMAAATSKRPDPEAHSTIHPPGATTSGLEKSATDLPTVRARSAADTSDESIAVAPLAPMNVHAMEQLQATRQSPSVAVHDGQGDPTPAEDEALAPDGVITSSAGKSEAVDVSLPTSFPAPPFMAQPVAAASIESEMLIEHGRFPAGQDSVEPALWDREPSLGTTESRPTRSSRARGRIEEQGAAAETFVPDPPRQWLPAVIWLLGFAGLLGRMGLTRIALWRFRRHQSQPVLHTTLAGQLNLLRRQLGLRRRVQLRQSHLLAGPVAFGIFGPVIVVPERFLDDYTPLQQEAMLAHELAHLAAHDAAWGLLADVVVAALWWHPWSWWARRQFHHASETAADEACLVVDRGPQALADGLVQLARRLNADPSSAGLGITGRHFKSRLGQRVERLLELPERDWRPPPRRRCRWVRLGGSVAAVLSILFVTAWAVPRPSPQSSTRTGETIMRTLHQSWHQSAAAFVLAAILAGDGPALAAESAPPPAGGKIEVTASASRGATPPGAPAFASPPTATPPALAVRAKLERITLEKLAFDEIPLSEVVRQLMDDAIQRDPEKIGVNFVFSHGTNQSGRVERVDPATGLPMPWASGNEYDYASMPVRILPEMQNVRLIDVLEVITKVVPQPLRYSIEDYGVLLYLDWSPPPTLSVRHFQVETATFFDDMQRIFGLAIDRQSAANQASDLHRFLAQLGVNMSPTDKAVYFNDRTGILMVRATVEELELIEAAITMLGGTASARPRSAPERTYSVATIPRSEPTARTGTLSSTVQIGSGGAQPADALSTRLVPIVSALPRSEPGTGRQTVLTITVTEDPPHYQFRGQSMPLDKLQAELTAAAQSDPNVIVTIIKASRNVPHAEIVKAFDAATAAGIGNISLRTE